MKQICPILMLRIVTEVKFFRWQNDGYQTKEQVTLPVSNAIENCRYSKSTFTQSGFDLIPIRRRIL